ncbi:dolichyl-phosphate beta-glucosyltransferase [Malassezia cuniculi]|uniref:dolichyl-phosphate beta-glucosyltransferase n=1 Tax=Malassezia cuniculi TaxID=948313 RepID=A0AAF0EVI5_9BASI|nr:dolichyl-phosphate beta-glucosyltransferase [Malassezia cuniculi]
MGAGCCMGHGGLGVTSDGSPLSYVLGLVFLALEVAPASILITTLAVALVVPYLLLVWFTPAQLHISAAERKYVTSADSKPNELPNITDDPSVQLTVVVPAYNEARRLPGMLDETLAWLEQQRKEGKPLSTSASGPQELTTPLKSYEILVVDDGSADDTSKVALECAKRHKLAAGAEVRVTSLQRNRGKGAAVRHGVLHSRGAFILFADADGATRFSDLRMLANEMARVITPAGHGVVVGSRAHLVKTDAVVKRSFLRNLLMRCFHIFLSVLMRPPSIAALLRRMSEKMPENINPLHWLVPHGTRVIRRLPLQPEVKDTQCGFKFFSRNTARMIFPLAHIDRWIFDVELLLLAEMASRASERSHVLRQDSDRGQDPLLQLPVPISEVAVNWTEIDGSKISLISDSLCMARDLLVIRMNYLLGRWKCPPSVYPDE